MKKYTLLFVFSLFFIISCSDSDDNISPTCGVNNPAKDLDWLKTEIDKRNNNPSEDMKYCYIVHAEYEDEAVFVYQDCNPLINKAILYLNCQGDTIDQQDSVIVFDQLKNRKIIWKQNDFACQVSF